ncbi:expressed unknown protein [Seminavis robusta]|uniref:Uncharacterized protein n=1 Tax=Seminavis robusta TaxID=568900 RepID=A0A9N8H2I4_9STRA|nr:expressed unknown protein [Seminavis robusta]|eukprot:Sro37_g023180.1 n/a (800) ;mRNA; f:50057-52967
MANQTNGTTLPPNSTLPPELSFSLGVNGTPATTPILLNGTATLGAVTDDAGVESTGVDGNEAINSGESNGTPVFLPAPYRIYEKAAATTTMSGIPRFGHPSDFSYVGYLASNTNSASGEDYLVGFLSGEPFTNPHINDPLSIKAKKVADADGKEYLEDDSWVWKPRCIRITFFFCGLIQIIFAILLVTKGVENFQQTTDTIQISTESMRLYVKEAVDVSLNLKQEGDTGWILRDQVILNLDRENFCPGNPLLNQTEQGQKILLGTEQVLQMLNELGDFISFNVATLETSLEVTQDQLDSLEWTMADTKSPESNGGLVAFPYLILASAMIVGAVTAQANSMTDCFLCVLNWVVLPLYIFQTVLSYIALGVVAIGASLNADFCGGQTRSPDQVMLDTMFRLGFKEDGLLFQIVRYYAYQCTERAEVDPFLFLRKFDSSIAQGREAIQNLTESMDEAALQQLSLACNRDFHPLQKSLGQTVGLLDALLKAADRALNLLRCETLVPFYTDIVYDGTCTYSITGFAWLFACLLIVSVMGMMMIMFRASYQNTIYGNTPGTMKSVGDNDDSTASGTVNSSHPDEVDPLTSATAETGADDTCADEAQQQEGTVSSSQPDTTDPIAIASADAEGEATTADDAANADDAQQQEGTMDSSQPDAVEPPSGASTGAEGEATTSADAADADDVQQQEGTVDSSQHDSVEPPSGASTGAGGEATKADDAAIVDDAQQQEGTVDSSQPDDVEPPSGASPVAEGEATKTDDVADAAASTDEEKLREGDLDSTTTDQPDVDTEGKPKEETSLFGW